MAVKLLSREARDVYVESLKAPPAQVPVVRSPLTADQVEAVRAIVREELNREALCSSK